MSKELLRLIATGDHLELVKFAKSEPIPDHLIQKLEAYETTWQKTSEYRAAVIFIHRYIAKKLLREEASDV